MICTIYLLTNKINNKVYVGQTWLPLKARMGPGGCNYKNSVYLYSAIKKYGSENFIYQSLAYCETQKESDITEVLFISQYDSRNSKIGYNLKEGGSVGKHSTETKAKIGIAIKNKKWSPEALLGRSIAGKLWKGRKRGPQDKDRKQQTAENMKEWHANNTHPMTGKTQSEEAISKMRNATKEQWKQGTHSLESIKQGALARMMDPKRENDILQAYKDGKTIADIESIFNTGRSSIYRILKRNNIARKRNK